MEGFNSDDGCPKIADLSNNSYMATGANIRLPDDLLAQAKRIAQAEGKTADDIASEAVKRDIARRLIAKLKVEGRPSGLTEDQEIEISVNAVHDYRRGR